MLKTKIFILILFLLEATCLEAQVKLQNISFEVFINQFPQKKTPFQLSYSAINRIIAGGELALIDRKYAEDFLSISYNILEGEDPTTEYPNRMPYALGSIPVFNKYRAVIYYWYAIPLLFRQDNFNFEMLIFDEKSNLLSRKIIGGYWQTDDFKSVNTHMRTFNIEEKDGQILIDTFDEYYLNHKNY